MAPPSTSASPDPKLPIVPVGWLPRGLHLFALTGFAVAQPLFDVLGRDATFFVARRAQPEEVYLLVAAVLFAAPLVLLACEALGGLLGRRFQALLHLVFVGGLVLLSALPPFLSRLGPGASTALGLGVPALVALVVAAAYARWAPLRAFLGLLSAAPPVYALLFLWGSPVRSVLVGGDVERPPKRSDADTTVVFLVLDELPIGSLLNPEGEIDAKLFPNFAALAADGTWFRNASASHCYTHQVLPSILSGTYPRLGPRVPTYRDVPENLFSLLAGSHRLVVREAITNLCPPEWVAKAEELEPLADRMVAVLDDVSLVYAHMVLPAGLRGGLPAVNDNWGSFRAGQGVSKSKRHAQLPTGPTKSYREFLQLIDDEPEPTLYFLHLLLPHKPWRRLPSGHEYAPSSPVFGALGDRSWSKHEAPTDLAFQQHLLQLGYLDRLLGELVERLRTNGLYERSLIVVMGDHGISFEPLTHQRLPREESVRDILHSLLIIRRPGESSPAAGGRVDDRNVESIDILPTIAAELGAAVTWEADGRSVFDSGFDPELESPARTHKTIWWKEDEEPLRVGAEFPDRWPLVERKERLFGPNPAWEDLYGMGTWRELAGTPESEFTVTASASIQASLEGFERFFDIDTSEELQPVFVRGILTHHAGASRHHDLAFGVNGVIRSLGRTSFRKGPQVKFAAMLPVDAFVDGRNVVRIFSIQDERTLTEIPVLLYEAVEDDGGIRGFQRSDGEFLELAPGKIQGALTSVVSAEDYFVLYGWSAEIEAEERADAVLFLLPDGRVFSGPTGQQNVALAARTESKKLQFAAFRFSLPSDMFAGDTPKLRLFGVRASQVTELGVAEGASWIRDD